MGEPLIWTAMRDTRLEVMRAACASWEAIADELGFSRQATIDRAHRIGAWRPALVPPAAPKREDPNRPSLPAGHPRTWGLINRGTCLEGSIYRRTAV